MVTQSEVNAHNLLQQQASREQDDLMSFLNTPSANLGASFDTAGTNVSNNVDDIRTSRKERKPASFRSRSRSSSKSKRSSLGGGPIDTEGFAPPPLIHPDAENRPNYKLNAENEANYDILPKYDKIRHSGYIMTRFSAMSLMTKKWRQNFWILYGDVLYFFRSREDFESWLLNPYLSRESRAALVKRFLNFKDKESKNFVVGKANVKYYRNKGMMHHFKLDKHFVRGSNVSLHLVAAFASMNQNDVIELQILLRQMLKGKNNTVTYNNRPFSDTQSAYSSEFNYTDGRSSAVSSNYTY